MAIVAECPKCGKRFKADEKQAGKKAKCSQCAHVFVIGEGVAPVPAAVEAAPAVVAVKTEKKSAVEAANPFAPAPVATTPTVARPAPAPAVVKPEPAPQIKPEPQAPTTPKRSPGMAIAAVAALALIIAGAVFVPRMLKKGEQPKPPIASNNTENNNGNAKTASHIAAPAVPVSSPAWQVGVDQPVTPLALVPDYRLTIPAQASLRQVGTSVVVAAPPGPVIAVTSIDETNRADPPAVEVWNLTTQSKVGQFKLAGMLSQLRVSGDGAYVAGQSYEESTSTNRVEVWSVAHGRAVHTMTFKSAIAAGHQAAIGFPMQDQVAILADKLQIWDLKHNSAVKEIPLPPRGEDFRAAASSGMKLIALADARGLYLVDVASGKMHGPAMIPEVLLSHPRRRLALRAMEFSPDGRQLALAFDNRQATRRIAVYDVATGQLKEIHAPTAPVYTGGPDLQWLADGEGWLLGSGMVIDRGTDRQIGQIYGDLPGEGLGGAIVSLVKDRALVAWERQPGGLSLRPIPVNREDPRWITIKIANTKASLYDNLQCVSRHFGNQLPGQAMLQTGRLMDSTKFLAVNLSFSASLSEQAPDMLTIRPDQFILLADGQPRPAIGTLTDQNTFSLERPELDIRKGDLIRRERAVVFAVTGQEKSLSVRIGSTEQAIEMPQVSTLPTPGVYPPMQDRLPAGAFAAPDDTQQVSVRILSARLGPFDLDPEAADQVPLRVTYSSQESLLMAVTFEFTVNKSRTINRRTSNEPPKLALLTPNGVQARAVIQLPTPIPPLMGAGERRQHTALFLLDSNPGQFRLTWENVPVASVKPDPATARSVP